MRNLLADVVARGLDPEQGILFVIDGGKALRSAIRDVFGEASVQRCIRHKERNVLDHLPERERDSVRRRLRAGWAESDYTRATERLQGLAIELERTYPDAASSFGRGWRRLSPSRALGSILSFCPRFSPTNPCESMIEIVRHVQRNVKRWRRGDMARRWTAAGMLEAEKKFRRIVGYQHLAGLVAAIEREHEASTPTKEAATLVPA